MRGFRAKDADRDRYVELIEAAYVDGQIGDADRELRVGRALSAETLDELETLTRDLQRPAGMAMPTPSVAPPPSPSRPASRPPSRPGRGPAAVLVGLGLVVALVGAGVVAVVALAAGGGSGDDYATSTVSEPAASAGPTFEMTPAQVRRFVRAYASEFGTGDAYEVVLYPERVLVQVPVPGSKARAERWTWDGSWRQDATATAVMGPYQRVDVGSMDVGRLFANIDRATRSLDVEDARFTHAILSRWDDGPAALNIYVGNDFNESGFLGTTPAGEVVRRVPYAP